MIEEASKTFRANQRTHTKKRVATEKRDQKGHWGSTDKELWPEIERIRDPGFKGSSWRDILEMSCVYNTELIRRDRLQSESRGGFQNPGSHSISLPP